MSWWAVVLVALGFAAWSVLMLLLGAGIVKSSYTIPGGDDMRIFK